MKIVVNTRLLIKDKLDGIGRFSYETLKRITREHKEHHFVFAFDRAFDEEFIFSDNITPIVISPQARHPFLFYIWFEHSLSGVLNNLKPDLFLSPDGYLSLSARVKSLPVIHDLNFVHYPNDLPFLVRKYYNYFFPRFANKATRIATVSEYSKNDIAATYKIDPSIIDVVYNGANEIFKPITDEEKRSTQKKHSSSCDYFLFVGSLHPRKNIARLFEAFDAFKNSSENNVMLLIVGEKYWWTGDIKTAYEGMKYKNSVVFTGRVSQQDLSKIYGSALALTYVPYFEGFGIPIIEAMSCGVPVITSNVTSMPEISGDAALLVNPFSTGSIKEAMLKIYTNKSFRADLIQKGHLRKQQFSWDKSARLLWQSIEKTIAL